MEISNFCIYRYIDKNTNEILYVGKTDSSLENRINQHRSEEKFKNINANVEYIELKNNMETRFLEFYFINKWKPVLNRNDKYEYELKYTIDDDFEWKNYVPEEKEKPKRVYIPKEERKRIWAEKYIEEGTYFDLKHLHMNNFSKEEQELFIFICKKYLEKGDRYISFIVEIGEFEVVKTLLSKIQHYSLDYVLESSIGCMGYIDYIARKPLQEKYEFTARINPCLKDEWIEDLVKRYDAGVTHCV